MNDQTEGPQPRDPQAKTRLMALAESPLARKLSPYLPCLTWARTYNHNTLTNDAIAALIVTIMLIPQSLAYALLAGLPPEMGLYASILPLVAYTIFGTSAALAVGPVAVVSLMTATAIGNLGLTDPGEIAGAAITLAFLSGLILLAMGIFQLGFLANFLSHPVIAGFITASGIIIAASQLKHILGINASGHNLRELLARSGPISAKQTSSRSLSAQPPSLFCSGCARD